jgi:hypothetical protein
MGKEGEVVDHVGPGLDFTDVHVLACRHVLIMNFINLVEVVECSEIYFIISRYESSCFVS